LKKKITIFLILGFLIYFIDIFINEDENSKDIFISDQEINSLTNAWESQVGRPPNDDEIISIINDYVQEEILYREALNIGLDRDDRIIKRRLAQKITFLKQETFLEKPPLDEILNFYESNKDMYYINPTYSFTHYFFSIENNSETRANVFYKELNNNKILSKSDPFLLGKNFAYKSSNEIDRDFGMNFSENFNNLQLNIWHMPMKSSFGYHIVKIVDKKDGYLPKIDDIFMQVELDYSNIRKEQLLEKYISDIKSEYNIIINPRLKIE
tara:strand:- start:1511 stop:2314 length:804 start_codon:yes stop_codon:yes gene_type:complete